MAQFYVQNNRNRYVDLKEAIDTLTDKGEIAPHDQISTSINQITSADNGSTVIIQTKTSDGTVINNNIITTKNTITEAELNDILLN